MSAKFKIKVCCLSLYIIFGLLSPAFAADVYRKSTEGSEVVMDKLYPKNNKLELNLPNGGLLLNGSYVRTFLVGGGGSYFFNEEWGIGVDAAIGINQDKYERYCIENFYNDPDGVVGDCGSADDLAAGVSRANMGPAYVPIREVNTLLAANAIWNPIYGKALVFMSGTIYFDLFVEAGLGIALSNYYPKMETLKNGKEARGCEPLDTDLELKCGAKADESDSYGVAGRPDVQMATSPLINIGIGQKFHFAKKFYLKVSLRNMTLLMTPGGFENLFALSTGVGMRF